LLARGFLQLGRVFSRFDDEGRQRDKQKQSKKRDEYDCDEKQSDEQTIDKRHETYPLTDAKPMPTAPAHAKFLAISNKQPSLCLLNSLAEKTQCKNDRIHHKEYYISGDLSTYSISDDRLKNRLTDDFLSLKRSASERVFTGAIEKDTGFAKRDAEDGQPGV
jgi:hypothetical protein